MNDGYENSRVVVVINSNCKNQYCLKTEQFCNKKSFLHVKAIGQYFMMMITSN